MSGDEAMALLIKLPGDEWMRLFREGALNRRFRAFGRKMVNDHVTQLTEGAAGSPSLRNIPKRSYIAYKVDARCPATITSA